MPVLVTGHGDSLASEDPVVAIGSYKSRVTNVPESALGPTMNGALKVYQS